MNPVVKDLALLLERGGQLEIIDNEMELASQRFQGTLHIENCILTSESSSLVSLLANMATVVRGIGE